MFDLVTMLRSLSEADLQRAEEAAQAAAAERGSSGTPRVSVSDTDAAERALMTPNVYGAPPQPRCAAAAWHAKF